MWTTENRARYDRNYLRYPSDLTDAEWALIEPGLPPAKPGGNKRTVNLREIANGLRYILSTGCQWRAIPKDLPPRSTLKKGALHRPARLRCGQEDRQEAAHSRRHARPLDARHRACRRYPSSRRRNAPYGHAVRPLSFSPEALCRWWISGRRLPKCIADYSQARERRDRQALRSSPALRRAPKTLARRADLRLARAMPKAGQGLGMSQPQSARFPQARFYSPHASKVMQSKMMFPDRLLDIGF